MLFYGEAGCSSCHSGVLMTDQAFHNIGVPQFGPGKDESGLDYGRYLVTGDPQDMFAFRTQPLRNVALTGPWMHNGAFSTLESAILHHLDAERSLSEFRGEELPSRVRDTLRSDEYLKSKILRTLDPHLKGEGTLNSNELDQLMAFLRSLTSPSAIDLSHLVPESVPSGHPIWD